MRIISILEMFMTLNLGLKLICSKHTPSIKWESLPGRTKTFYSELDTSRYHEGLIVCHISLIQNLIIGQVYLLNKKTTTFENETPVLTLNQDANSIDETYVMDQIKSGRYFYIVRFLNPNLPVSGTPSVTVNLEFREIELKALL